MSKYVYHDLSDTITQAFIQENEPYAGYWKDSEAEALASAGSVIKSPAASKSDVRALDVGCGEGRLLPWISQFAREIDALEPDIGRLEKAVQVEGVENTQVTMQHKGILDIKEGDYDIIVCSHVLQHLATDDADESIKKMYSIIKPEGLLVLLYSKQTQEDVALHRQFIINRFVGEKVAPQTVSKDEFNQAVNVRAVDGLPVHLIDPLKFREHGAMIGWQPIFARSFHVISGDTSVIANDEWVNSSEENKITYGTDMLEIWQARK